MSEKDFQSEIIDRLARIETKLDATIETVTQQTQELKDHGTCITRLQESAKSAHKRIDCIYISAGMIGGAAGWVADKLLSIWSGKGGG